MNRFWKASIGGILGIAVLNGAASANPITACFDMARKAYERCSASCDYQVDRGQEQYDRSVWGTFNNNLMAQAGNTFDRVVREGVLSRGQVQQYNNQQQLLRNGARGYGVAVCESRCQSEQQEMESTCAR